MPISDDIKERLDITEVVSDYAPLQKAGKSFKAQCPFHAERTPSFFVFPERQTWRCFGACATGGDVFSFVMRAENLDFREVLRLLAQRAGVSLQTLKSTPRASDTDHLYRVNQEAVDFFQKVLKGSKGAQVRAYLEKRGVGEEAMGSFTLGFSSRSVASLRDHLLNVGFDKQALLDAGLVTVGESGQLRDMFRGRLMFPIRDEAGGVVGFGGRAIEDTIKPKYINTPRTVIFDKGRLLYGLDLAKETIRRVKRVVIVEGYMDVVAAHEHGNTNVVASMGTALTDHQVGILRSRAREYVLALDPDTAGREATWQVFERQRGLSMDRKSRQLNQFSVAVLPVGKDPDRLIREEPDRWDQFIRDAVPLMDYLLRAMTSKFDLSTSQGKSEAATRLLPIIAGLDNPFEQDRYFNQLAEVLAVSPETLEASIGRPRAWRKGRSAPPSVSPFDKVTSDPLEEHLLVLLLQHPNLREQAEGLREEFLTRPENRAVFVMWSQCVTMEPGELGFGHELEDHLNRLQTREIPPTDHQRRVTDLRSCIRRLEERHLREMKAQEELLLSQGTGDLSAREFEVLQRQIMVTNERLRQIFLEGSSQRK